MWGTPAQELEGWMLVLGLVLVMPRELRESAKEPPAPPLPPPPRDPHGLGGKGNVFGRWLAEAGITSF